MLLYLFFLTLYSFVNSNSVDNINNLVIESIIIERPYQTVIIIDNVSNLDYSIIRENLKLPKIIIDTSSLKSEVNSLDWQVSRYSRATSVYIIISDEKDSDILVKKIQDILNLIQTKSVLAKPKCLLIIQNVFSDKHLIQILINAWTLKFLDFTILNTNIISFYNPFSKQFYNQPLIQDTSIFPDKLKNMQKHPFQLAFYDFPPQVKANNKRSFISGSDFAFFDVFSHHVNCSLQYEMHNVNTKQLIRLSEILYYLENNTVNACAIGCGVNTLFRNRSIAMSKVFQMRNLALLVPVEKIFKLKFSHEIWENVFLFVGTIVIFRLIAYLFKISSFRVIHLFENLLGISTATQPKATVERIVYFTLALLSIKFSIDLFETLTEMLLVFEEKEYRTFDDVLQSDLSVYLPPFYVPLLKTSPDQSIRNLLSKSQISDDVSKIIEDMTKTKKHAFVYPRVTSKYLAEKYRIADGSSILKIATASFENDFIAFGFESSSVYVDKFNEILQRIIESGISTSSQSIWGGVTKKLQVNDVIDNEIESDVIRSILIAICIGGFSTSFVAFVVELCFGKRLALNSN